MRKTIVVVTLILACTGGLSALMTRFLDIAPGSIEARLIASPDSFDIRTGGLISGGVASNYLSLYQSQIDNLVSLARSEMPVGLPDQRSKAQYLFGFMYSNVLKEYRESATTLDVVLRSGRYNCLSATLTYSILLDAFGISNRAVVLPSHVYSRISVDGHDIDVENTSPNGFDVSSNAQAQKELKRLTGLEYSTVNDRTELVGKRGLFAYSYANVSYYASLARQPESSFRNAACAVELLPNGKYIGTNLIAAYTLWAISLSDYERNWEKALGLLDEGISNYPAESAMKTNAVYVLSKYVDSLISAGRYEDAFAAYEQWKRLTGADHDLALSLYTQLLFQLAERAGDFDKAYDYSKRALAAFPDSKEVKGAVANALNRLAQKLNAETTDFGEREETFLRWYALAKDKNFDIILENFYSDAGFAVAKAGDPDRALGIFRKSLAQLSNSTVLRGNAVYVAGNEANDSFSKKDWNAGLSWCRKALEFDPANSSVLENMRTVYRMQISDAIDARDYVLAKKTAAEALRLFPNDDKILYYRKYIDKKTGGQ
jgi:tetratricopeptide (TPR) repeat protein